LALMSLIKMIYDFTNLGFTRIAIDFYDEGKSSIKMFFSRVPVFFKYLFASMIYNFILWVGLLSTFLLSIMIASRTFAHPDYKAMAIFVYFIFLSIPIFYFLIKFWLYSYFIADKNMGAIQSLRSSYQVSSFLEVFLLGTLFFVFYLLLSLFFSLFPVGVSKILGFVSNFILWFLGIFAGAFLYRRLT